MALFDLIPQPFLAGFVTSEAELRAFDYTTVGDGNLLLVQLASGRTSFMQWSATSLSPDDPDRGCVRPTAIIVTAPGRWLWYDYAALAQPKGAPAGQIGGTWASPDVRGIRSSDGTLLPFGVIADGQAIVRAGAGAVGSYAPPGGVVAQSVRVASTANIATLSGLLTVDSVVTVAGDLVLAKNQATASQNGVYVVAAGAWARAPQANSDATLRAAQYSVREGTANGTRLFVNTNTAVITVGTTALTYGILGRLGTAVTPVGSSGLGNTPGTSLDASPADHRHQVTGALFGPTAMTFGTTTDQQLLRRNGTTVDSVAGSGAGVGDNGYELFPFSTIDTITTPLVQNTAWFSSFIARKNFTVNSLVTWCFQQNAGNLQMGIYSAAGNLLVATTAVALVANLNVQAITATTLTRNTQYFFAIWTSANGANFGQVTGRAASTALSFQMTNQLTGLPATFVNSNTVNQRIWMMGD